MVKPVDPVVVTESPIERIVSLKPEVDRARIEKEIQGLTLKLKWTHIPEALKDVYKARIMELQEIFKSA